MKVRLHELVGLPRHPLRCDIADKVIYGTREDAEGAVADMRRRGNHATDKGTRLRVYRHVCGGYHIGHKRRGRRGSAQ